MLYRRWPVAGADGSARSPAADEPGSAATTRRKAPPCPQCWKLGKSRSTTVSTSCTASSASLACTPSRKAHCCNSGQYRSANLFQVSESGFSRRRSNKVSEVADMESQCSPLAPREEMRGEPSPDMKCSTRPRGFHHAERDDYNRGMDSPELDRWHMARALELAQRGEGFVEPNPMVGCVVAHGAEVIGEGFHRRFGGPHAEVEALAVAAARRGRHAVRDPRALLPSRQNAPLHAGRAGLGRRAGRYRPGRSVSRRGRKAESPFSKRQACK